MLKPYSKDLRIRVVRAVQEGGSIRSVAKQCFVSPSFVSKICKLYRETQDVRHKKYGGHKQYKIAVLKNNISNIIEENKSITLKELQNIIFEKYQINSSISSIGSFVLKVLRFNYKKKQFLQQNKIAKM